MNTLDKAYKFMQRKHKGQKYGKREFFYHPLQVFRVVELLRPLDQDLQVAALLHDTLEQTTATYEEIERLFGKPVADLVQEVTKTEYNTFPHLSTQDGVLLKFADRLCNVSNMDGWTEEKIHTYLFEKSKFWK